jgi:cyclopropane fatty-acyl-phospholipid synthase-like methyltransferase
MNSASGVQDHFDRDAERFDTIYRSQKRLQYRVVDRLFRQVVVDRFRLVCNLAPLAGSWTVLDVGCGSGRYGTELVRRGADHTLGIDFSERMIALAQSEAARAGVADRCQFEAADFLAYDLPSPFDIVLAMGYFDYLDDPAAHLQRMLGACGVRLIASFPKRWEWRVPIRKVRFRRNQAFVRFYSRNDVERLMRAANIPADRFSILSFSRDWIVIVRAAA